MKILQVQFKNRNGHAPAWHRDPCRHRGKVPFVVHLHGFAGSCNITSPCTPICPALAAQGIGSARFDFGNGEDDGEFEDMSFDGLHTVLGYLCMGR